MHMEAEIRGFKMIRKCYYDCLLKFTTYLRTRFVLRSVNACAIPVAVYTQDNLHATIVITHSYFLIMMRLASDDCNNCNALQTQWGDDHHYYALKVENVLSYKTVWQHIKMEAWLHKVLTLLVLHLSLECSSPFIKFIPVHFEGIVDHVSWRVASHIALVESDKVKSNEEFV